MDFINLPMLAAAALVFVSVLAGLFSVRIGFSFLLVFLGAGMLDEKQVRAVFRDFPLDPTTTVAAVCEFYGLQEPADAVVSIADWMVARLHRAPVAGDIVQLGPVALVVRDVEGRKISRIGLGLNG